MKIKFTADNQNNLDYLRYIFNATPGEMVKVSLTDDFGRMAVALYSPSQKRDHTPCDDLTVYLQLPRHGRIGGTTTPIYYDETARKRLNMLLAARFNTELNSYYTRGLAMGLPRQEIIDSFIVSRGLIMTEANIAALTKKAYRSSLAAMKERSTILLEKARYNLSKIETASLKKT